MYAKATACSTGDWPHLPPLPAARSFGPNLFLCPVPPTPLSAIESDEIKADVFLALKKGLVDSLHVFCCVLSADVSASVAGIDRSACCLFWILSGTCSVVACVCGER